MASRRWNVYSFRQNSRTWRTHKQTDTAWQHRPHLHSIARQKLKITPGHLVVITQEPQKINGCTLMTFTGIWLGYNSPCLRCFAEENLPPQLQDSELNTDYRIRFLETHGCLAELYFTLPHQILWRIRFIVWRTRVIFFIPRLHSPPPLSGIPVGISR